PAQGFHPRRRGRQRPGGAEGPGASRRGVRRRRDAPLRGRGRRQRRRRRELDRRGPPRPLPLRREAGPRAPHRLLRPRPHAGGGPRLRPEGRSLPRLSPAGGPWYIPVFRSPTIRPIQQGERSMLALTLALSMTVPGGAAPALDDYLGKWDIQLQDTG